ncbi:hypothetical protein SAMN05444166_6743 [Singulisphaera sp. GP187]|uniref:hypothetical protein n=1 Tax=Singulisphaera sp. GP187 TaxID=1882752 RepID=UPI000927559B|nr:hypothetical protein [Singulisphaera sp. GP187]SIO61381.1 hypothetical protein SAMN05444166_6743 [Singulisphaera sp. GP187]
MSVIKRVSGVSYVYGGEPHRGWLPPGAAIPLPTPVHRVTLDITIEEEGPGYLLIITAQGDSSFASDSWFDTLTGAESMALEWFGIAPDQWQYASEDPELGAAR